VKDALETAPFGAVLIHHVLPSGSVVVGVVMCRVDKVAVDSHALKDELHK
jgi:hypothetical protein